MEKHMKANYILPFFVLCFMCLAGCTQETANTAEIEQALEEGVYINGKAIELTESGSIDLPVLSVENGITVQVVAAENETVYVNGEEASGYVDMDISSITREDAINLEIEKDGETTSYEINLMPSTFPGYTTEGESATDGDFYLSTYDLSTNYIFKLNNQGELIFYKEITKTDEDGNEVNTNGLDFRKQYNSDGEVRYTYMPYLEESFADGDCSGINPGCVVVMDENYEVIDEIYYLDENGDEILIDPHGFMKFSGSSVVRITSSSFMSPTL